MWNWLYSTYSRGSPEAFPNAMTLMSWWLPTMKPFHCYIISVILLLLWIICYAGYVICDPCGVAAHILRTADVAKSLFLPGQDFKPEKISDFSNMSQVSDSEDGCQVKLFWQILPYLKKKPNWMFNKTFLIPTSQHFRVSTKSKCLFDHLLPSSSSLYSYRACALLLLLPASGPLLNTILCVYTIPGNFRML